MEKKAIYRIIEWAVALAACGYLVWRIATYEDYASLWASLQAMGPWQYMALAACVALMPVNMAVEAWKWVTLWNSAPQAKGEGLEVRGLSFAEAQRQVYYSKLAGLITPWRLGEYPARGFLIVESLEFRVERSRIEDSRKEIMARVVALGAVGSATMTGAILIAGMTAILFSPSVTSYIGDSYLYGVGILMLVGIVVISLMPTWLKRWAEVSHELVMVSLGQSVVRLACWCVQLALVIWAMGGLVDEGVSELVAKCAVYYLLVTVTPNMPVAEAGVRGAWAIVVFGTMNAALAGVVLWVVNTVLPCISWFFVKKHE